MEQNTLYLGNWCLKGNTSSTDLSFLEILLPVYRKEIVGEKTLFYLLTLHWQIYNTKAIISH